jgi:hypothetical protein
MCGIGWSALACALWLPLPTTAFVNVNGGTHRLVGTDCVAQVLVFIGHDCPISNGYSREIERLRAEFAPQRIAWCVVYADADLSLADAQTHARTFGLGCPALLDPPLTLARQFGITVKPEVAVVAPTGRLLYRGRIDDRYVDFGKRREHLTSPDLRNALVAITQQQPIAVARTKAIGCDIDFSVPSK